MYINTEASTPTRREVGKKHTHNASFRVAARTVRSITRVRRAIAVRLPPPRRPTRARASPTHTGTRVLVKESHTLLKLSDLLRLHVLVHALALQPACPSAFPRPAAFRCRRAQRSQDEVVQLRQHRCGKQVDLQLDFFRALRAFVSPHTPKKTEKRTSRISGTPSWIMAITLSSFCPSSV